MEIDRQRLELERDRWFAERTFRESELEIKRQEQARSGWRNPLVLSILGGILVVIGNIVVSCINGKGQRYIENQRAEDARILEMIKTEDTEKAAENLKFLLAAGLIENPERIEKLNDFLTTRKPGTGPTLPISRRVPPLSFYLPRLAKDAAREGRFHEAEQFAEKLLATINEPENRWNYGNAIHDGHIVLGLVALHRGNNEEAISHLLTAGRTPGSPTLSIALDRT